jgi:hypothetical protein
VKPSELIKRIIAGINGNIPLLISGAPGVGKSDLVEQAAKQAGAELLIMHPVVSDPTDFKGFPFKATAGNHAEFLPYGDLLKLMNSGKLMLCFFDDLGQATAAVQAAIMQILLNRAINGKKISSNVRFICATNRKEDGAGVSHVLEPLKGRAECYELEPDLNDWCNWAINNGIMMEFIAFARFRPEFFTTPSKPTKDMKNSFSIRNLSRLSIYYQALKAMGINPTIEDLEAAVGSGCSIELYGFLDCWKDLPDLNAIEINPASVAIPDKTSVKYAVSIALVLRATLGNIKNIASYVSKLGAELEVVFWQTLTEKNASFKNCMEFGQFAARNGNLLTL